LRCSLKPYRVERNGNELFVYNKIKTPHQ